MVRLINTGIPSASGKFFLFASALLCLALLFPSDLFAQSDEWQKLSQLALSRRDQGDFKGATESALMALELAEQELPPEHPAVVVSLDTLASLYFRQGQYGQAEPLYKRALAILEKALGPDNPLVASSLNNLAGLYRKQGRVTEAEPLYQRSLAILEKAIGPDHPSVAESLDNLGELYRAQGRYAEAETLYTRLLSFWERAHDPDHPKLGMTLSNLAELYRAQGRYAEAEPLFKRALAIYEKAFGSSHPDAAVILENYAKLLRATGQHAQADEMVARLPNARVTQEKKKNSVAITLRGNDPVGVALAAALKEVIRASQSFRLVDHEVHPSAARIWVMLSSGATKPREDSNSMILALVTYDSSAANQLLSGLEQNCDQNHLEDCAQKILSKIDQEVEWLRKNMWDLWKNL